jgi:hypothetical protein
MGWNDSGEIPAKAYVVTQTAGEALGGAAKSAMEQLQNRKE